MSPNGRHTMANTTKKFTLASLKSFVRKSFEAENLFVLQTSSFDSMQDMVTTTEGKSLTQVTALDARHPENTLGVQGMWVVGSGNMFTNVSSRFPGFEAWEVYNCCGSCIIARKA